MQTAAPGTVDLGRGAPRVQAEPSSHPPLVVDIGSGAGFPGLPIKIWAPDIHLTLIESTYKKATFLREVIRALTLTDADVFVGRAEAYPPAPSSRPPGVQTSPAHQSPVTSGMAGPETAQKAQADVVTLRAIEHFDLVLSVAALLLRPGGQLALLLGASQVEQARTLLPMFRWEPLRILPQSAARVFLVGSSPSAH